MLINNTNGFKENLYSLDSARNERMYYFKWTYLGWEMPHMATKVENINEPHRP